ncbi:MAG: O-methyltransferase [Bacteroidales bacterium]|nr:O-methyltransferase [Bacteroidales bacterium]
MDIKTYIEANTSPLDGILQQIERETHIGVLGADMLAGQVQGRLLEMLSRMISPLLALEVGTFTGFSTVCLARGLRGDGNNGGSACNNSSDGSAEGCGNAKLITLENNDEFEERIRNNLTAAGVAARVELRLGDALQTLRAMPERDFDLIYLDADKERYLEYYPLLVERLRAGGFLLVDNTLWYGKVADETVRDKTTELMRKFNAFVASDPCVECVMLPIRDGLTIIRKCVHPFPFPDVEISKLVKIKQ